MPSVQSSLVKYKGIFYNASNRENKYFFQEIILNTGEALTRNTKLEVLLNPLIGFSIIEQGKSS